MDLEQLSSERPAITPSEVLQQVAALAEVLATVSKRLRSAEDVQESMGAQLTAILDVLQTHKAALEAVERVIKRVAGGGPGPMPGAGVLN